jgi:hypothetical protein
MASLPLQQVGMFCPWGSIDGSIEKNKPTGRNRRLKGKFATQPDFEEYTVPFSFLINPKPPHFWQH